jgi:lysophospholipase L1-like esterase
MVMNNNSPDAARKTRINLPPKKDIAVMAASIIFTLILVEAGLRIWLNYFSTHSQYVKYSLYTDVPAEMYQWSPHHYLNYYPTPGYKKGLTYHNSLGYRSREFNPEKPANTYRVVLLGGSTTYTASVKDNDMTFPYQLERILRSDYGRENIEVINAGVSGYNSWESLVNLQFRVLDIDPDLVIVYHGTNDVHTRLVSPDAYKGDNSGRRKQWSRPGIPLFEHSLLLRYISKKSGLTSQAGLGTLVNSPDFLGVGGEKWNRKKYSLDELSEKYNLDELLANNPPVYFRRNLINMTSIARANDVSIAFATWSHSPHFNDYASTDAYQAGFRENNEVVKAVAARYGAYLFDFAAVMPQDKEYWSDGRHVNEVGALLKAKLFADFILGSGVLDKTDTDAPADERH